MGDSARQAGDPPPRAAPQTSRIVRAQKSARSLPRLPLPCRPSYENPAPASTLSRPPQAAISNPTDSADDAKPAERAPRKPAQQRLTSAIAGRAGPPQQQPSSRNLPRQQRNNYTAFPADQPEDRPRCAPAPASGMYWSKAPVSGIAHPSLRAHTTTLVGSNIFVFGGCDSKACFKDLYVFDADSFHWSRPYVAGDIPLPLRAMTCTAVGKKLVVFGGGDGPAYYNDVYVLDTVNFKWSKPRIVGDRVPSKRRAHTACLHKNGIYVFGGGDGVRALNDIWRLDVSDMSKMSWKLVSSPDKPSNNGGRDARPKARGYHTANMADGKLIIFGGSDGGECFNDVWAYDIEKHVWKAVNIPVTFRRLSHTSTIVGSYLFVVGGHDGNEYSNEVLLLNLVTMTWDTRKIYGLPPSGRGYHGTVLYDSRLFIIGGLTAVKCLATFGF
ncbi:unnamed protein product [Parascedosporium putredinis]|uniref:Attractin/MKLN-like beta-propeller domain-containing protein n=1 Tax=Parascedosporium putredinis TaxID=1442378 RepID=A0A9P1H8D1_9PEZI|nr:unnamed protein product [Parascedosporium putredinis]CAI8002068.1 unnamed protein product [Parascedosporium putredinis]